MKGVQVPKEAPQRVEIVEEPTCSLGGPTYKNVQPKTYKVLQQELGGPDAGVGEEARDLRQQPKVRGSGCKI